MDTSAPGSDPLDAVVVDLVAAAAHHGREAEDLAREGTV